MLPYVQPILPSNFMYLCRIYLNTRPSKMFITIIVNRRRLVRLASDVTECVIVHFLFWSCDQYRAWMLKSHITNNNIITVFADLRTVFSPLILLSKLLTT